MNLGNILKQRGGTPETGRPVRFQVRQRQKDGTHHRLEARALLLPVSASAVSDIQVEVSEFLSDNPRANRDDEVNLRFIGRALRDAEKPALPFALADNLKQLSDALTVHQIAWLLGEYALMMRTEYPEIWESAEEREKAEEEAADFSTDGQD